MMFPGAFFGALRRQNASGILPGAVLAFVLLAAAFNRLPDWNEPPQLWHRLGILAGASLQVLLVGAKKRNFLDVPLDSRIVLAASIGAILRGASHVVSGLIR